MAAAFARERGDALDMDPRRFERAARRIDGVVEVDQQSSQADVVVTVKTSIVTVLEHAIISPRVLDPDRCPGCPSRSVRVISESRTMTTRPHTIGKCECSSCALSFERHAKGDNVWHTTPAPTRVLIAGVATCHEDFRYKCACGGVIARHFTELDGVTAPRALRATVGGPKHYRVFWTCGACAWGCETEEDHATDAHADHFAGKAQLACP